MPNLTISVDLQGFDEFISKLDYLKNGGILDGGFRAFCNKARQIAVDGTPVGDPKTDVHSGLMKKSWEQPKITKTSTGYQATITNTAEYGMASNYGHSQEPGRYVPAINARLVHYWVPGTYALEQSMDKAEMQWSSVVRPEVIKAWNSNRTNYYDRKYAEQDE